MILIILLILLLACKFKPWRRFSSLYRTLASRTRTIKSDDLERPLVSEDLNLVYGQSNDFAPINAPGGESEQISSSFRSPLAQGLVHKQRLALTSPHLTHSDSFVLDIPDSSEDALLGQTLARPTLTQQLLEVKNHDRKEETKFSSELVIDNISSKEVVAKDDAGLFAKDDADHRSTLTLEVISGPSRGTHHSILSTNTSKLPLTLGRVSPSDLLLKDSEVSGKHAMINWNPIKSKWELVDMGSLNGTHLNSLAVHHPHSGSRHWGDRVELKSGDIITLGTSSKILVQVTSQIGRQIPFGVGIASDPMTLRRGGKELPMEDVCYYQWPLSGMEQFGLFGICDGHGGASAATSVSKVMPETVARILSDSRRREQVLSQANASDVLREAFYQTEACLNQYYEGCTATVLLLWTDVDNNFYAQCANVGDSACFMNIDGKQVKMTEDHRISSFSERLRIQATGEPLKDGETRLCGLNLARMLGDKFLKEQDARFSSEPYVSDVICIQRTSRGSAILASDGFWDVISSKKAFQLVQQARDKSLDGDNRAEKIANLLLSEAKTLRTKDNTSIIFLDFDGNNGNNFHKT